MYALEILRNRTKEVKALRKGDSFLMYSLSKKNVINRPIGPVVNDSECYRAIKAYIFTQEHGQILYLSVIFYTMIEIFAVSSE